MARLIIVLIGLVQAFSVVIKGWHWIKHFRSPVSTTVYDVAIAVGQVTAASLAW